MSILYEASSSASEITAEDANLIVSKFSSEDYQAAMTAGFAEQDLIRCARTVLASFSSEPSYLAAAISEGVTAGELRDVMGICEMYVYLGRKDYLERNRHTTGTQAAEGLQRLGDPPREPLTEYELRIALYRSQYLHYRSIGITPDELVEAGTRLYDRLDGYGGTRANGLSHTEAMDLYTKVRETRHSEANYMRYRGMGVLHEAAIELLQRGVDDVNGYGRVVLRMARVTHEQVMSAMERDLSKTEFPMVEEINKAFSYFNALDTNGFDDGSVVTHERAIEWLEAGGPGYAYRDIINMTDGAVSHDTLLAMQREGVNAHGIRAFMLHGVLFDEAVDLSRAGYDGEVYAHERRNLMKGGPKSHAEALLISAKNA